MREDWRTFFTRPAKIELLIGNATKARQGLRWETRYAFAEIVKEMFEADLSAVASQPRAVSSR